MAARPSSLREPSLRSIASPSRRSSQSSNPDVFSDDYALEPIDAHFDFSLVDNDHTEEEPSASSSITPYPAIPNRLSIHNRPASTAKRTNADEPSASRRDGGSVRTSSTSSRFSRIRAQSPYRGPTAPSHPYAMYPQVTRASSIASQSTIRPPERPFVHTGGPEHPYGLYAQNTVDDDDDDNEDIGTQPIPLGFSALGYGSPRAASNSDVGDIVLSDGHIEQLPPYTRYADNVIAKGNMRDIDETRTVEMDTGSSERSSLMQVDASAPSDANAAVSEEPIAEVEIKEPRWRKTAHKRVCGGIALWLLILVAIVVLLAGLLGGVIGGVVGRRQGATDAQKSGPETTIWVDADRASTNSSTPTCPTGRYSIPFKNVEDINSCIADPAYGNTWGCLDIQYLGMVIGRNDDGSPNVQFDDYSVDTTQFLYGPQPPDFNGSTISLAPHMDNDNTTLGVAMFFYQEFDKLVILPSYAIEPNEKRSISAREIHARGNPWDKTPLATGDQPWYCFWNSTINEFWIFLEQSSNGTRLSTSSSSTTTSSAPPPPSSPPPMSASSQTSTFPSGQGSASYPTSSVSSGTWSAIPQPTPYYPMPQREKRSYTTAYLPQYPRLVKMIEKRKGENNTQPYCQQMRVLDNWEIVPQENGPTIMINELEWSITPILSGYRKRDTTNELKSNCVCEWMST